MVELKDDHPLLKSWNESNAFHLDVRELLENGGEPYSYIMDCLHQLMNGEKLVVHVLFEPKPLILQVQRLGYQVAARRESEEHWIAEINK